MVALSCLGVPFPFSEASLTQHFSDCAVDQVEGQLTGLGVQHQGFGVETEHQDHWTLWVAMIVKATVILKARESHRALLHRAK